MSEVKDDIATCKIMDYQKFLYSQEKKAKANKKAKQDTKEIRLSDAIADNDMKTKAKNADKILSEGDKLQISVVYKGRQVAYIDHGFSVIDRFMSFIKTNYRVVKPAKIEGTRVAIMIEAEK